MADHVFHRPGPLKQANKSHKTGRHRSKGAIDNALKGKVSGTVISHKHKQIQRREQRRNQMNQLRKNKREEALALKRQLGGQNTAPFLVCILPMHLQVDPRSALAILESCDEEAVVERTPSGVTYINVPRFKQRFAFIIPPVGRGNEVAVLDYLKVCDTTLMLTSAAMGEDDVFDKWGHRIFNMISAQSIPTPIVALMDLESLNPKRRGGAKAAAQKFISKLLPKEKIMQLDTNPEGLNVMRRIGGQKKNIILNRNNRPHLFGDHVEFIPNPNPSEDEGTLKVTGFLRGTPLDVNGLVHITGLGDFQMSEIHAPQDPYRLDKSRNNQSMLPDIRLVAKADPARQTSLQSENVPDPMDAEQTWPTEEEIAESQKETKKMKLIKRVPKGYSAYQAAWIPDVEEVEANENEDKMDDDDASDSGSEEQGEEEDNDEEDEFMSCENKSFDGECERPDSDTEEYVDSASVSDAAINDEKYDQQMDFHEERETMRKIKEARVDELWPDEIDTPLDIPARTRFQKFRGLESFRTSPWDPKENLPSDYARIYQFQNFDRTKRRIINEAKEVDGAVPGWYISIYVANVPATKWNAYKSAQVTEYVVVYGLLPHEHQMSVMNVVLKRLPDSEVPIKSKERLIIQCGFRRFVVNPIFSQHTNGDKHKFERYFRPHTTVCATFYAPIQFPPAPILAFKTNPDSTLALVARGCLLSCNPDRIILKRVVLSGHPMRINRKSATIRYMFFNKEDVEYFKPVKLRTKCGRLGHIKESLGTHGHMKCYFDGQLKSYDTAFMYLFKRVYPKWTYDDCLITCEDTDKKNDQAEAMQE
ncbi:pre-rRNA-processing protein TSR1 homolog [Stomoxys calcitrans]|uniref:pre-rRNA-processing protein TSR1 homolog n=1 Tax=Stomoxys calcitrans TaxID=35570 RepID=UPI0027E28C2A|nr:pre-rRNA-processing protein TSR1 homolog [Stomoxys calcitrans]